MSKGSLVAQRMVFDGVINVQHVLLKKIFLKFKFPIKLWCTCYRNMLTREDNEKRKHKW